MKFKTPAVAIAAFIAGSMTIPSVVSAQSDDTPADTPVPAEIVEAVPAEAGAGAVEGDLEFNEAVPVDGEVFDFDDYEPTAEDIAEWNAETDTLIEALKQAGVDVGIETDDLGLRYPTFGEDLTDAEWEKIDEVFASTFGDFDVTEMDLEDIEGLEDYEPTPEELAEWNAATDEWIAELEAAGIPVERNEEDGIVFFDLPDELTPEQEAAVEDFFGDCEEIEADNGDQGHEPADIEGSVLEV